MKNRTFANRLLWALSEQGYTIGFEHDNGFITCVISKGKQEVSAKSNNVSSSLYIAWHNFKEKVACTSGL